MCMMTSLVKVGCAQFVAALTIMKGVRYTFAQYSSALHVGRERCSCRAVRGGLQKECADARSPWEVEFLPLAEKNRAI